MVAVPEAQAHVIVGRALVGWRVGLARREDAERAGHAEMAQPGAAVVEFGEEILGPPVETAHRAPRQAFGESGGKIVAQSRPCQHHLGDFSPFEKGLQAAPHRFHFRQFRHPALSSDMASIRSPT